MKMSKSKHDLEDGEIVNEKGSKNDEPPVKKSRTEQNTSITGKTGGAYIPPARLRMMQQMITDKSSAEYQRISWEALKKSINGLINKVNVSNISSIVRELFQENVVRGRGILAQSILQAQNASPTFTQVYAALVSIINTRFPQNGELILRRLAIQFRQSYKRNRKDVCLHSSQFIAHLINQQVAHEIIGLQILTLLLETPTDDSVEVAIGFLKESGQKLMDVSPRGLAAVMQRMRTILHEQELDKRVQYMIEVMFAIRKDGFKEHPAVTEELDLVEESDQFTHMLQLDDDGGGKGAENVLNVFHVDENFVQNEENYKQIKKDILDESSEGSSSSSGGSSSESSEDEAAEEEKTQEIEDLTETNLVALRRTIYLAIQSSLDFEECAHKLLKMEFDVKDYKEICAMIIDCCSQQRTYEKFYGLLGARFCILKKEFMENFEILFAEQYSVIHRLETNKLRNVAKLFAHLLHSDALPWTVLSNIRLSEDTTTSSSRIFIKILFQELVEYLGLPKLNQRLKDETLSPFFEGLFPRDNPKDTRFAINFFTSIGLGGVTDELREHLKDAARAMTEKLQAEQLASLNMESTSSDSDDESSSDEKSKKSKKKKSSKRRKKVSKKSKSKESKKKKKSKSSSESEDSDSESDSSSPHRKVKSSVVMKSQTVSQKTKKPDEPKGRKQAKENGNMKNTKDISKKKKKRTPSSSDASSSSASSDDEAHKKSASLRERLLKISNTVSKESSSDRKKAEIPIASKSSKKSSVKEKQKHTKRHSSSSESSSESSESDSDDSDDVVTTRKPEKNLKQSSKEKRDKEKRNGARNRKNSSDEPAIHERDKIRKSEIRSQRDRYENRCRENRVDDYEKKKERSHPHRRRSRSLGR